eukprot:2060309-Amphidinium_carterae.1
MWNSSDDPLCHAHADQVKSTSRKRSPPRILYPRKAMVAVVRSIADCSRAKVPTTTQPPKRLP